MLTLLIASRNGTPTLPRVLDAYTRLRPPPGGWKVVFIDNASDDDTLGTVRSFADRLPLHTLHEPRPGKNRALNLALPQIEGDLAVFADDDCIPEPDWLLRMRAAADEHRGFAIFAGYIVPAWDEPPPEWVIEWVRAAAVFGVSEAAREDGPCEANRVFGTNMAIRAEWFRKGYRFDEDLGPNGSTTYAMGGETELTLRLAIAEGLRCWHCSTARIHHIVGRYQLQVPWILKRAFHLGRCVHRESRQLAAAGLPHVRRGPAEISKGLSDAFAEFAAARQTPDARCVFEARWAINLWFGCLYEALTTRYEPPAAIRHAATQD